MDADGDYIPKSVLNGNKVSIVAWTAWKKVKYGGKSKSSAADKGIHRPASVPANNSTQTR